MSACVNSVALLGNLGGDPVTIKGGIALRLATSERWTDSDGHKQERTSWHRCVLFGKRATPLATMLRKGSRIYVAGSLQSSEYEDKHGEKRTSVDVIVSDVVLCDPAPAGARARHERGPRQHDADDMPGEG